MTFETETGFTGAFVLPSIPSETDPVEPLGGPWVGVVAAELDEVRLMHLVTGRRVPRTRRALSKWLLAQRRAFTLGDFCRRHVRLVGHPLMRPQGWEDAASASLGSCTAPLSGLISTAIESIKKLFLEKVVGVVYDDYKFHILGLVQLLAGVSLGDRAVILCGISTLLLAMDSFVSERVTALRDALWTCFEWRVDRIAPMESDTGAFLVYEGRRFAAEGNDAHLRAVAMRRVGTPSERVAVSVGPEHEFAQFGARAYRVPAWFAAAYAYEGTLHENVLPDVPFLIACDQGPDMLPMGPSAEFPISTLVAGVLAFFGLSEYHTGDFMRDVGNASKTLAFASLLAKSASGVAHALAAIISWIGLRFFEFDPLDSERTRYAQSVAQLSRELNLLRAPGNMEEATHVQFLREGVATLMATQKVQSLGPAYFNLCRAYSAATVRFAEADTILRSAPPRTEPVHLCMDGPPGCGKTFASIAIFHVWMQLRKGRPFNFSDVFTRGPDSDKFWEGMTDQTEIIHADELFSFRNPEDVMGSCKLLMALVSNGPWSAPMAFGQKGTVFPHPSLMLTGTNGIPTVAVSQQVFDRQAIARRMDLVAHPIDKAPFRKQRWAVFGGVHYRAARTAWPAAPTFMWGNAEGGSSYRPNWGGFIANDNRYQVLTGPQLMRVLDLLHVGKATNFERAIPSREDVTGIVADMAAGTLPADPDLLAQALAPVSPELAPQGPGFVTSFVAAAVSETAIIDYALAHYVAPKIGRLPATLLRVCAVTAAVATTWHVLGGWFAQQPQGHYETVERGMKGGRGKPVVPKVTARAPAAGLAPQASYFLGTPDTANARLRHDIRAFADVTFRLADSPPGKDAIVVRGFFVAPRVMLTYGHWARDVTVTAARMVDCVSVAQGREFTEVTVVAIELDPTADLALVEFDVDCQEHVSLFDVLAREEEIPPLVGEHLVFADVQLRQQVITCHSGLCTAVERTTYGNEGEDPFTCDRAAVIECQTFAGQCGNPYYLKRRGRDLIAVVHVAGNGISKSCGAVVTQEKIRQLLAQLNPAFAPTKAAAPQSGDLAGWDAYGVRPSTPEEHNFEGLYVPYVVAPHARHVHPRKSKLHPSPFQEGLPFGPLEYAPARFDSRDGLDRCANSRTKIRRFPEKRCLEVPHFDVVREYFFRFYPKIEGADELSLDAAVLGDPDLGLSPLCRETAAGVPCSRAGGVKKRHHVLFKDEGGVTTYTLVPGLEHSVRRGWELAAEGRRDFVVFAGAYKDELRKLAKVDRPRFFYVAPLAWTINLRRSLGMWICAMHRNPARNPSSIGINVHGMDWTVLAQRLMRYGGKVLVADYKDFDGSQHVTVALAVISLINEWYGGRGAVRRATLMAELYNVHTLEGCSIFETWGPHCSGDPACGEYNGGIEMVAWGSTFCIIAHKYDTPVTLFDVIMAFYGDDNAEAAPPFPWDEFADVMHDTFGMTITSNVKSEALMPRHITDPSVAYLSRAFVPDGPVWNAPLPLARLAASLYWTTSLEPAVMQDTVSAIMMELVHHGRQVHDAWRAILVRHPWVRMHGLQVPLWPESHARRWALQPQMAVRNGWHTRFAPCVDAYVHMIPLDVRVVRQFARRTAPLDHTTFVHRALRFRPQMAEKSSWDPSIKAEGGGPTQALRSDMQLQADAAQALTSFTDAAPSTTETLVGGNLNLTPVPALAMTIPVGMDRFYKIASGSVALTDAQNTQLFLEDFPDALLAVPQIQNYAQTASILAFKGVRARLVINCPPPEYGGLVMAGAARGGFGLPTQAYQTDAPYLSGFPSVIVQYASNPITEFYLPYVYPVLGYQLDQSSASVQGPAASLAASVLFQLRTCTGDTGMPMRWALYAGFDEPVLQAFNGTDDVLAWRKSREELWRSHPDHIPFIVRKCGADTPEGQEMIRQMSTLNPDDFEQIAGRWRIKPATPEGWQDVLRPQSAERSAWDVVHTPATREKFESSVRAQLLNEPAKLRAYVAETMPGGVVQVATVQQGNSWFAGVTVKHGQDVVSQRSHLYDTPERAAGLMCHVMRHRLQYPAFVNWCAFAGAAEDHHFLHPKEERQAMFQQWLEDPEGNAGLQEQAVAWSPLVCHNDGMGGADLKHHICRVCSRIALRLSGEVTDTMRLCPHCLGYPDEEEWFYWGRHPMELSEISLTVPTGPGPDADAPLRPQMAGRESWSTDNPESAAKMRAANAPAVRSGPNRVGRFISMDAIGAVAGALDHISGGGVSSLVANGIATAARFFGKIPIVGSLISHLFGFDRPPNLEATKKVELEFASIAHCDDVSQATALTYQAGAHIDVYQPLLGNGDEMDFMGPEGLFRTPSIFWDGEFRATDTQIVIPVNPCYTKYYDAVAGYVQFGPFEGSVSWFDEASGGLRFGIILGACAIGMTGRLRWSFFPREVATGFSYAAMTYKEDVEHGIIDISGPTETWITIGWKQAHTTAATFGSDPEDIVNNNWNGVLCFTWDSPLTCIDPNLESPLYMALLKCADDDFQAYNPAPYPALMWEDEPLRPQMRPRQDWRSAKPCTAGNYPRKQEGLIWGGEEVTHVLSAIHGPKLLGTFDLPPTSGLATGGMRVAPWWVPADRLQSSFTISPSGGDTADHPFFFWGYFFNAWVGSMELLFALHGTAATSASTIAAWRDTGLGTVGTGLNATHVAPTVLANTAYRPAIAVNIPYLYLEMFQSTLYGPSSAFSPYRWQGVQLRFRGAASLATDFAGEIYLGAGDDFRYMFRRPPPRFQLTIMSRRNRPQVATPRGEL